MVRTTIMAEEETLYRIGRIAEQQGRSKAAVIREALAEYVVEAEKELSDEDNPLLGLVGIADVEGEPDDLPAQELGDWKKEWAEYLGRNL